MSEDPRLSGLYREGAGEEPPAHLDAAIRAAARREVGARPRPTTWSPFPAGWRMPLALAALLVVAATVVSLVMEERREEFKVADRVVAPTPSPAPEVASSAPKAAADGEAPRPAPAPAAATPAAPAPPFAQAPAQEPRPAEGRFAAEPPPAAEAGKLARADVEAADRRAPPARANESAEARRQAEPVERPGGPLASGSVHRRPPSKGAGKPQTTFSRGRNESAAALP